LLKIRAEENIKRIFKLVHDLSDKYTLEARKIKEELEKVRRKYIKDRLQNISEQILLFFS
jgi:nitrogen regulatory protein PII-like uncharacterized protein